MTMTKPTATFLALDLETTGLDPDKDQILECAAVVLGPNLFPGDVPEEYEIVLALTSDGRARLADNEFVTNMHTTNGLLEECADTYEDADGLADDLLAIIDAYEWTEGKPILLGNTIRFDHGFLRAHFPDVAARFHHRQLDVSASILLAHAVGVDIPKGGAHRAMADVRESIATAQTIAGLIGDGKLAQEQTKPLLEDVARRAFAAYVADVGGVTYDGKPIPTWDALSSAVQSGWLAAAYTARNS